MKLQKGISNCHFFRQPEVVHFNSQVEYFSRPPSILYFLNRSSRDEDQPDVVQDCVPSESVDEEIKESKFKFLRKKSVMIRRKVSQESADKVSPKIDSKPDPSSDSRPQSKYESVIFHE